MRYRTGTIKSGVLTSVAVAALLIIGMSLFYVEYASLRGMWERTDQMFLLTLQHNIVALDALLVVLDRGVIATGEKRACNEALYMYWATGYHYVTNVRVSREKSRWVSHYVARSIQTGEQSCVFNRFLYVDLSDGYYVAAELRNHLDEFAMSLDGLVPGRASFRKTVVSLMAKYGEEWQSR